MLFFFEKNSPFWLHFYNSILGGTATTSKPTTSREWTTCQGTTSREWTTCRGCTTSRRRNCELRPLRMGEELWVGGGNNNLQTNYESELRVGEELNCYQITIFWKSDLLPSLEDLEGSTRGAKIRNYLRRWSRGAWTLNPRFVKRFGRFLMRGA